MSDPRFDNPYASPQTPADGAPSPTAPGQFAPSKGLVGHVKAVAVLMIIQGVLELIMGGFVGAMAVIMPAMFRDLPELAPARRPDHFFTVFVVMYGALAAALLGVALLRIAAGVQNYRYRSRTLGIVALIAGTVTSLTCYCAPTSIALAVYGLVVYLNREVGEAFAAQGVGLFRRSQAP